jgi:hypothetical protein
VNSHAQCCNYDSLGRKQGPWPEQLSAHGMPMETLEGIFVNDERFGIWTYKLKGKKRATAHYEFGLLDGPFIVDSRKSDKLIVFFESGKATSVVRFLRNEEIIDVSDDAVTHMLSEGEMIILKIFTERQKQVK